jgi:hypothetical protein
MLWMWGLWVGDGLIVGDCYEMLWILRYRRGLMMICGGWLWGGWDVFLFTKDILQEDHSMKEDNKKYINH